MARDISTRRDMLRHTLIRTAVACAVALVATPSLTALTFGVDPAAQVSVGSVFQMGIAIALVVSLGLGFALTYRSARLMNELTVTRAKLLRLSRTDLLTGLLNRRGFEDLAESTLLANRGPAGVLMCDIDRFKAINDRFGHEFGDKVLVAIADIFRSFAEHESALVARHGGEEFVLLLTGPAAASIEREAELLRTQCATTVSFRQAASAITVSIGYASFPNGNDLPSLMRAADDALYVAKRNGRNQVAAAHHLNSVQAA